jgi:hypothetical protein
VSHVGEVRIVSCPDKDLLVFVKAEKGLAMIENIKLSPNDPVV